MAVKFYCLLKIASGWLPGGSNFDYSFSCCNQCVPYLWPISWGGWCSQTFCINLSTGWMMP